MFLSALQCFAFVVSFKLVFCGSALTSSLVRKLIAADDVYVRPDADYNSPTNISFSYTLTGIEKLKDRDGIFHVYGYLDLSWNNSRLKWNSVEFGNVSIIRIPSEKMWKPDLVVHQNLDYNRERSDMFAEYALVLSDGTVQWFPRTKHTVACDSILDENQQKKENSTEIISCKLKLGSWAYDGTNIDFTVTNAFIVLMEAQQLQYRVMESSILRNSITYSCCPENYVDVTISFKATRLPKYL